MYGAPQTDLAKSAFRIEEKRYKLDRSSIGVHAKRARPTTTSSSRTGEVDESDALREESEPATDFSEVVDFRSPDSHPAHSGLKVRLSSSNDSGRAVWAFKGVPGLYFLPRFLSCEEQAYWAKEALDRYSHAPFPNNLSNLSPDRADTGYVLGMRWSTLGITYDWSKKAYMRDRCAPFPEKLTSLCRRIVADVNGAVVATTGVRDEPSAAGDEAAAFGVPASWLPPVPPSGYGPQAAIVNYFPVGTMMMAHQDISEEAMSRPLVSISIGCSAVFLMGTTSREDRPFAFFLRSGDVAVFTGPSRAAFHSVPRIVDDCPAELKLMEPRLHNLRININARQVFEQLPEGMPTDA
jgi:alkylated DNA repair protein alkB family protein 1